MFVAKGTVERHPGLGRRGGFDLHPSLRGTIKDYEEGYRRLIEQTTAAVPGVRIVICEPFELRKWIEFDPYRAVAKKLAADMGLTFVPFHDLFLKAAASNGTDGKFWAWDGIHPTIAGHTLMRRAWREAVGLQPRDSVCRVWLMVPFDGLSGITA